MAAKKPATLKRQARQTPQQTPMRVPAHGRGQLKVGGVNPGGGRPKDEFKARMRELASGAETEAALTKILNDSTHPHYMKALAFAAEHGYGKPTDHVEVSGKDGGPIAMTVTFRK
jgi:hypothetical protein